MNGSYFSEFKLFINSSSFSCITLTRSKIERREIKEINDAKRVKKKASYSIPQPIEHVFL